MKDQTCPSTPHGINLHPDDIARIHGAVTRSVIDDIQDVANRRAAGYSDDNEAWKAISALQHDIERRHIEAWHLFLMNHGPGRN